MPYAAIDRQEFIKRSNLDQDARVLDFGGMLLNELPHAVAGIATPRPATNSILMAPVHLPFKNSVFDAVVSYHYFDLIEPDVLGVIFKEVARVLNNESMLSFMITLWAPQNESQRSSHFFNEMLRSTGALFNHEFEEISRLLEASGFSEITVESIKREITIPKEFTRSHLLMLENLIKKEKEEGGSGIRALARLYLYHAKEHGEAMLPAIHFTAKKYEEETSGDVA